MYLYISTLSFKELQEDMPEDLVPIAEYVEDTYIGRRRRHARRSPTYSIEIWNMKERAEDELPKTNNRIEGWHNKLQAAIGAKNPSLWTLITALQRDHALNEVAIAQIIGGHQAEPRRKKYIQCEDQI